MHEHAAQCMITRTEGAPHGAQTKNSHECSSRMGLTGPISRHSERTSTAPGRGRPRWYVAEMPELRGTVVLATYNSGGSVVPVLAEIEEAASVLRRSGIELDVLLVDDSSPDNTATIARDEAARLGLKIEVLNAGAGQPRTGEPKTGANSVGRSQLAGFAH